MLDLAAGLVHVAGGTGKVFALDIATGAVAQGWPIPVTREPALEHVFGALTLAGRLLYVTLAGVCDVPPFKGKAVGSMYDPAPSRHLLPDGRGRTERRRHLGRRWRVCGPGTGDVFVATGNAVASPSTMGSPRR